MHSQGACARPPVFREHGSFTARCSFVATRFVLFTDLTPPGLVSARVLRLVPATAHSRDCGCASATAADDAPTDCGLWRVSSLRLRCSCLRVWAFDCTATPNTADCSGAVVRDSELSSPCTSSPLCLRPATEESREPLRDRNSGRAQAPLRSLKHRRHAKTDTHVRSPAARFECERIGQTMRPREMDCASFGLLS